MGRLRERTSSSEQIESRMCLSRGVAVSGTWRGGAQLLEGSTREIDPRHPDARGTRGGHGGAGPVTTPLAGRWSTSVRGKNGGRWKKKKLGLKIQND